ncbi:MAG: hypothetical protein K2I45_10310 [Muribaculaceae bacterium]|nr:hypothetical protein [Muribaculaceae bacterium]
MTHDNDTPRLLEKAMEKMTEDMKARGIGAVIWSIPEAGFHYIPEIVVSSSDGSPERTARITGLYAFGGTVYAIEEDKSGVSTDSFYRPGVDVRPVVVTLSETKAGELFGVPSEEKGFTTQGTLEEWVAVADCYFEALAES